MQGRLLSNVELIEGSLQDTNKRVFLAKKQAYDHMIKLLFLVKEIDSRLLSPLH